MTHENMVFEIKNVSFRYDGPEVLHSINLVIKRGELIGIIGPNGAGKSTLLNLLNAGMSPSNGELLLEGNSISTYTRLELARKIATVPQFSEIVFPYRVMELVMMARHPHVGIFEFEGKRDVQIVTSAMEQSDVLRFADKYFQELSGGEKQGVIIARALAQETPILLLDEPTSSLDLKHQKFIYTLLRKLCDTEQRTIVVVSHDINLAGLYCDSMILLKEGMIVKIGQPPEVIQKKLIEEVYETEVEILTDERGIPFLKLKREN